MLATTTSTWPGVALPVIVHMRGPGQLLKSGGAFSRDRPFVTLSLAQELLAIYLQIIM